MIERGHSSRSVGAEVLRLGLLIALSCAAVLGILPTLLESAAGR
ncbi:MAG TPA: hypothetical protein VFI34_10545 [Candidatus Limnocylindrales bacterium]|nr:hypothetical protein [Candidatus Limnocylindrales bacterium]